MATQPAITEVRLGRWQCAARACGHGGARDGRCHRPPLAVTLTATAELAWWPADAAVLGASAPAARVAQLVRAGRLWVGSSGRAVGLVVHPTLQGREIFLPGRRDAAGLPVRDCHSDTAADLMAEWTLAIASSPVWPELGLAVHPDDGDDDDDDDENGSPRWRSGRPRLDAARLFFSVRSPTSPGGLCTPAGVPRAQFRRLVCHLHFVQSVEVAPAAVLPPPPLLSKKKARPKSQQSAQRQRARPRKPAPRPPAPTVPALRYLTSDSACPVIHAFRDRETRRSAAALIEASLHTLVGMNRRVLGVQPIGPAPVMSSLLAIAPAVWNQHYFQAVSSRAVFVPTVCRLLSSFAHAQSPSLRRKTAALVQVTTPLPDPDPDPPARLDSKLQEILLKFVSPLPPRKRSKPKPAPVFADQGILARPAFFSVRDMQAREESITSYKNMQTNATGTSLPEPGQRFWTDNADKQSEGGTRETQWSNEDDESWKQIEDLPELDCWSDGMASWEESKQIPANHGQYEKADYASDDDSGPWQEIDDWQLDAWGVAESPLLDGWGESYCAEGVDEEESHAFMDVDMEDMEMWDVLEQIDQW